MKKKVKIIIIFVLIIIIIGFLIKFKLYYEKQEAENIKIDEYNLSQLEKAKPILESIPEDTKKIFTVNDFNKLYNSDITPIKNCYYINTTNGNEPYIFGFKLESKKYKKIFEYDNGYIEYFGDVYYAYPKYDLAPHYFCGGSSDCSDDMVLSNFRITILNSCEN